MAHYLASPGTEADTTMNQTMRHDLDFSMEQTFHAPEGRDALFKTLGGARQPQQASTPRNPLATVRNLNARSEFTPMLKSATANRTRQVNGLLNGKLTTPAGLKRGYQVSTTPLPEASSFDASSSSINERTPMPEMHSSSDMSTPMVMPRKGEGEMDNGNGNVLTLREQEAVSASNAYISAQTRR